MYSLKRHFLNVNSNFFKNVFSKHEFKNFNVKENIFLKYIFYVPKTITDLIIFSPQMSKNPNY